MTAAPQHDRQNYVRLDDQALALIRQLDEARRDVRDAKAREDAARIALNAMLDDGGSNVGVWHGMQVLERQVQVRRAVSIPVLRDRYPEAAEDCERESIVIKLIPMIGGIEADIL